jgi:hypothetical protein
LCRPDTGLVSEYLTEGYAVGYSAEAAQGLCEISRE